MMNSGCEKIIQRLSAAEGSERRGTCTQIDAAVRAWWVFAIQDAPDFIVLTMYAPAAKFV
jgi:hypothetical protein